MLNTYLIRKTERKVSRVEAEKVVDFIGAYDMNRDLNKLDKPAHMVLNNGRITFTDDLGESAMSLFIPLEYEEGQSPRFSADFEDLLVAANKALA